MQYTREELHWTSSRLGPTFKPRSGVYLTALLTYYFLLLTATTSCEPDRIITLPASEALCACRVRRSLAYLSAAQFKASLLTVHCLASRRNLGMSARDGVSNSERTSAVLATAARAIASSGCKFRERFAHPESSTRILWPTVSYLKRNWGTVAETEFGRHGKEL